METLICPAEIIETAEAQELDRLLKRARRKAQQLEALRNFGTIGFDAYVRHVLEENGIRPEAVIL